jgi:hypothetical protein
MNVSEVIIFSEIFVLKGQFNSALGQRLGIMI